VFDSFDSMVQVVFLSLSLALYQPLQFFFSTLLLSSMFAHTLERRMFEYDHLLDLFLKNKKRKSRLAKDHAVIPLPKKIEHTVLL